MKSLSGLSKPKYSPLFLIVFVVAVFAIGIITMQYYWAYLTHHLYKTTFQSPLPDIVVAKRAYEKNPKVYLKQYDFSEDMFTLNIPVWEKVLEQFKGKANMNYLEVGTYEGGSVIWMLENILTDPTAKMTAIDIFQGPYKDKYFANIELSGLSNKVTTITNYSQLALRDLPLESFDIIYIDGSHAKNDVLEDAVLSWRLLREGGLLIFDDYRYVQCYRDENISGNSAFPKIAIDLFVQCFDKQFEVVHNASQLILRRIK